MVSVSQTDNVIRHMNVQADLHQCFMFAYGTYRLCQVELQDSVIYSY